MYFIHFFCGGFAGVVPVRPVRLPAHVHGEGAHVYTVAGRARKIRAARVADRDRQDALSPLLHPFVAAHAESGQRRRTGDTRAHPGASPRRCIPSQHHWRRETVYFPPDPPACPRPHQPRPDSKSSTRWPPGPGYKPGASRVTPGSSTLRGPTPRSRRWSKNSNRRNSTARSRWRCWAPANKVACTPR